MILSLLICTIPKRKEMLDKLLFELRSQVSAGQYEVEILVDPNPGTIGAKRQRLLLAAQGDYVSFIDDDDEVATDYLKTIIPNLGVVDAIGFEGEITTNGRNKKRFSISMHHGYHEKSGVYYRFNNHLSPVKRSIALAIGYKDIPFAEDYDYALRLHEAGLVKTEKYIYKPMYFYRYLTKKPYT